MKGKIRTYTLTLRVPLTVPKRYGLQILPFGLSWRGGAESIVSDLSTRDFRAQTASFRARRDSPDRQLGSFRRKRATASMALICVQTRLCRSVGSGPAHPAREREPTSLHVCAGRCRPFLLLPAIAMSSSVIHNNSMHNFTTEQSIMLICVIPMFFKPLLVNAGVHLIPPKMIHPKHDLM